MVQRRKAPPRAPKPTLRERTSIAEWCAAGLGLLLTLGVVGYSAWEAASGSEGPPDLRAEVREIHSLGSGHVAELEVRNLTAATAADVVVTATLQTGGAPPESHSLTFDYVPGRGAARGGVVFRTDPAQGQLTVVAEGYAEP